MSSANWKEILNPKKLLEVEIAITLNLKTFCGLLTSGEADENDVVNVNEAHSLIDVDNDKTLVFTDCNDVTYVETVSDGEGSTMIMRISGKRDAITKPPFIFYEQRQNRPNLRDAR